MSLKVYTPEMNEPKPVCQAEASMSHYGNHYFLKTPEVISGRGIEHICTFTSQDLTPQAQSKVGWHEYKLTNRAFDAFCKSHDVAYELLLD